MNYLLDTCVIIDLVKGDAGTIQVMKSKTPDQVAISTITEFELRLWYGAGYKTQEQIQKYS